jgi:thioredoxin reductase-like selenoprotein T
MIILLFAGDYIFRYLQSPYPGWYLYMKNNKLYLGVVVMFGLNFIIEWVGSSGAFEVIYDGTILYSKLGTGQIPTVDQILSLLSSVS